MPFNFVVSAGVSVVDRWMSIPARLRVARPGTVTSALARSVARSPCKAAADRWESTAPGPQARTAAIQRPWRESSCGGVSEETPWWARGRRPAAGPLLVRRAMQSEPEQLLEREDTVLR